MIGLTRMRRRTGLLKGKRIDYLVASAYFAHVTELLGNISGVLQKAEDEAYYLNLAKEIKQAFSNRYILKERPPGK